MLGMAVGAAPTTRDLQRKRFALLLFREAFASLHYRFAAFFLTTALLALATLLPARLYLHFHEGAHTLASLPADAFLRSLLWFGGLVALCLFVASFADSLLREWLRLHLETDLRRKVLRRIHQIPLGVLDESQRGDLLNRFTSDLDHVELFFTDELPKQIRNAAIVIGSGVLFFLHSGALTLVPLLGAVLLVILHLRVQRILTPIMAELRQLHGGVFHFLLESLEGLRTIRSHAIEPFVERRFENSLAEISGKSLRVARYLGAVAGGTELFGQVLITGALTLVAWSLSQGQLTLEQVFIYPFFLGLFCSAAGALAHSAYDWNRFFIEGGRLGEILYDTRTAAPLQSGRIDLRMSDCTRLEVRELEVGYEGVPLADPLTFTLQRGEIWAILGPSGGGKSTLLEVLAGLRTGLGGRLSLSTAAGKRIWHSSSTTPKFPLGPCAFVEQHPYLFEGTLRDNLIFGNPDRLSEQRLWDSVDRVGLSEFLHRREGLDFKLLDRGKNVSEGERYRIALCRSLLLDRPFLLLDEPFAALDSVSLERVIVALEKEKETRGVALVTHYFPEAFSPDKILDLAMLEDLDGRTLDRALEEDRHIRGQRVFVSPQDEPILLSDRP